MPPGGDTQPWIRLACGQFYGYPQLAAAGAGFDMRVLAATTCEQQVALHTHTDAHFVLVLSGHYLSSARGVAEAARAPLLIFNPPGTTHRDRFAGGVGTFATVSIDAAAFAANALLKPSSSSAARLCAPAALRAALLIARELQQQPDLTVLESLGWELLTGIAPAAHAGRLAPPWAARAYAAVMDGASEASLTVADLARDSGVHPVHLARGFRRAFGWSPGELLRWRRVDRAATLLRHAELPLAEIAQRAGFVDQSHLTHAFRATLGCAPGAYRRAHVARIQDAAAQD